MVTEYTKKNLDLSSFDLEYAELLMVRWLKEINEITLKLRCPVAGWPFKETRIRFLRFLGLGWLLSDTCVEYLVTLTFVGVTDVAETLISQGHTVVGSAPSDTSWMESLVFEIESIRIVRMRADLFRFHMRSEDLQLDFNFAECFYCEECLEK
jgi:hypothetical protein